ncbi:MAG: hypothetical protein ACI31R_01540 [Bacilli bacterium]
MKKRLYSLIIICTILILIVNIFTKSSQLTEIISFSINLFIKNIFPSLFPMFIIASILVEIDIPKVLGNIFKKPMRFLFKTKGEGAFIFFMSMITGFPSSAKYLNDLIEKKVLNNTDCEKILMFTFFSNPLFIVNTVGNIFFNSIYIGFIILICHILGNIVVGLIFRNYHSSYNINDNSSNFNNLRYLNNKINDCNIFKTLLKSIRSSLDILINVFGIVTFFLILINLLFKDPRSTLSIPIIGLTEMTTGLKYLSMSDISINIRLLLSVFFISFGGFSVHFQIMSILNEKKVKYLPFLLARLVHAISSCVIYLCLLQMDILF